VVDASNPDMDAQMYTVYDTLRRLEVGDKKVITAFNKVDLPESSSVLKDLSADYTVRISAKTGEGIPELLQTISQAARDRSVVVEKVFSYQDAGAVNTVRKYGQVLEEEYRGEGVYIKAQLPREYEYLFR
jgi:GTP-binding protein HflX